MSTTRSPASPRVRYPQAISPTIVPKTYLSEEVGIPLEEEEEIESHSIFYYVALQTMSDVQNRRILRQNELNKRNFILLIGIFSPEEDEEAARNEQIRKENINDNSGILRKEFPGMTPEEAYDFYFLGKSIPRATEEEVLEYVQKHPEDKNVIEYLNTSVTSVEFKLKVLWPFADFQIIDGTVPTVNVSEIQIEEETNLQKIARLFPESYCVLKLRFLVENDLPIFRDNISECGFYFLYAVNNKLLDISKEKLLEINNALSEYLDENLLFNQFIIVNDKESLTNAQEISKFLYSSEQGRQKLRNILHRYMEYMVYPIDENGQSMPPRTIEFVKNFAQIFNNSWPLTLQESISYLPIRSFVMDDFGFREDYRYIFDTIMLIIVSNFIVKPLSQKMLDEVLQTIDYLANTNVADANVREDYKLILSRMFFVFVRELNSVPLTNQNAVMLRRIIQEYNNRKSNNKPIDRIQPLRNIVDDTINHMRKYITDENSQYLWTILPDAI